MHTWIIKKTDIAGVLDMKSCIDSVEKAFRLYGQKHVQMPFRTYLTFDSFNGDLRSMSAYIPDFPIAGVKAVNVHPDNRANQMATVMATIILIDPSNGFPLAIMDGTQITNMRTGAAGAVASRYLAKNKVESLGFVGAGTIARSLLDALLIVYPDIRRIHIFDIDPGQALKFYDYCSNKHHDIKIKIEKEIAGAVKDKDIVNTSTASRQPLFNDSIVSDGTHINAIGADAEGKQEISASVLKKAVLVIDDWAEASHTGEINVPIHMGELTREDINADLGEIVSGQKKGRESDSDITVFDSAGLALQDIVTAWDVYGKLIESEEHQKDLLKVSLLE